MSGEGDGSTAADIAAMRRFDINRSGVISALDALFAINALGRRAIASEIAEGMQVGMQIDTLIDDDDEVA